MTRKITIDTVDEYEAATARAKELMCFTEGSEEEAELAAITDAIMIWDRRHDDATSWQ